MIEHGIDTEKVAIGMEGPIIVGKFVDIHEKPTLTDNLLSIQRMATASKDKGA